MIVKRLGTTSGGWEDTIRWYQTVAVVRTLLIGLVEWHRWLCNSYAI